MLCARQKQRQDFLSKQRRLIRCFLVKRKRSNGMNMVNSSSKLFVTLHLSIQWCWLLTFHLFIWCVSVNLMHIFGYFHLLYKNLNIPPRQWTCIQVWFPQKSMWVFGGIKDPFHVFSLCWCIVCSPEDFNFNDPVVNEEEKMVCNALIDSIRWLPFDAIQCKAIYG